MISSATHFGCGHPREGNSIPTGQRRKDGGRIMKCRFCNRVHHICRQAERDQQRINAGRYTLGQRIVMGVAR